MKDVTPGLLEELNKTFEQKLAIHPQIRAYKKKLEAEKLDEKSVALFIREMVSIAAATVASVLRPEKLPDGKLYWNIAEGVLVPFLKDVVSQMSNIAVSAQKTADQKQNINIKVAGIRYPEGQIRSYLNMIVRKSLDEGGEGNEAGR